jgi:hypothetical protein
MKIEEMNEGVRILIDRIKTNPEEFSYGVNEKWSDIIGEVCKRVKKEPNGLPFLHDEEVKAIYDHLVEAERQEFTAQVLRKLAGTPQEDDRQLDLPYMPAMPRSKPNLTVTELKEAKRLGVTPEVYAEAKAKEANNQRVLDELRRAYEKHKAAKKNP